MDDETREREAPLSYRPPKALRAEFDRRVSSSGLSAGAFITQCVFGGEASRQSRRPAADHAAIARLLVELARIRDQLREIELTADGQRADTLLLEQAVGDLAEIRAACFKALGRRP